MTSILHGLTKKAVVVFRDFLVAYRRNKPMQGYAFIGYHASDSKFDGLSDFRISNRIDAISDYIASFKHIERSDAYRLTKRLADADAHAIFISEEPFMSDNPDWRSPKKKEYKYGSRLYEVYVREGDLIESVSDKNEIANNARVAIIKSNPYLKECTVFLGMKKGYGFVKDGRVFIVRNWI